MDNLLARIELDPLKRFGKPYVKGTRITVGDVLGWLALGMTNEQILTDYLELSKLDLQVCLAYAAEREDSYRLASRSCC